MTMTGTVDQRITLAREYLDEAALARHPSRARQRDQGHGRDEHRTLKAATVAAGLAFPHAAQAIRLTRRIRPLTGGKWRTTTVYAVTSLTASQASPAQLAG
jgi:hypothetical protein